ncbi:MAG: DNA translocase FtsK 4TM domain-containing protein [Bacteroidales bacterium]|nr:DNA translocase FtsK 4TM domain-containing protein [Bacteroidales bacterium]
MTKKRNRKNTPNHNTGKKKSVLRDERIKILTGLFILGFSLLITLAFISYFFTWKTDQSFENQRVISGSEIITENWAGKVGAYFSNIFIGNLFGIASFGFPFLLIIIGFRLLNVRLLPLRKTIRIVVIGGIILSVTLGFLFGSSNGFFPCGLGGGHGFFIAKWLESFLGTTGTAILITFIWTAFFIFSSKATAHKLKRIFIQIFKNSHLDNHKNKADEDEGISFVDNNLTYESENFKDIPLTQTDESFEVITTNEESVDQVPAENSKDIDNESNIELTVNKTDEEELVDEDFQLEPMEDYDPTLELSHYKIPPLDLLKEYKFDNSPVTNDELERNKNKIVETLGNYKIDIIKIRATIGPTVTLYEIVPAPGIKISRIKNLEDDIALSLAALGIRIIAPIPGRGTIGIEVPNENPEIVSMRSILSSVKFQESKYELPIALGKTISNETYVMDLTKMPHLLVAGATGQGKSVGLNAIITSLLYKMHPAQLKFVLIDPKKVELTLYAKIEKHFLAKLPDAEEAIITDTKKVVNTLHSLTIEMDTRYELLKAAKVRNIKEYNEKFIARRLHPDKGHRYLPYIVMVVDEFADLIMTAGKEIETPIARLAQLARAIGIHLIIATQRPTTNIITGVIKANFPARIAFRVTAMIDSRTILDSPGANQLIGRGDMLISQGSDLIRLQCAFIDIPELEKITDYIESQQGYASAFMLPEYVDESGSDLLDVDLNKRDELFDDAARLVVLHQQGSTSLIQRKFSIGYNRAGRIMDQLEAANIVGPFEGSKARQVLFPDEYSLEQFLNSLNN